MSNDGVFSVNSIFWLVWSMWNALVWTSVARTNHAAQPRNVNEKNHVSPSGFRHIWTAGPWWLAGSAGSAGSAGPRTGRPKTAWPRAWAGPALEFCTYLVHLVSCIWRRASELPFRNLHFRSFRCCDIFSLNIYVKIKKIRKHRTDVYQNVLIEPK